jgi:hypothetical protein
MFAVFSTLSQHGQISAVIVFGSLSQNGKYNTVSVYNGKTEPLEYAISTGAFAFAMAVIFAFIFALDVVSLPTRPALPQFSDSS